MKKSNATDMIRDVVKDFKLINYDLSHVVNSGTSHFLQLKVVSWEDLKAYREQVTAHKQRQSKAKKLSADPLHQITKPYTKVDLIDQKPVHCII